MNNYLFLLTISPVQSFIEQARKSQDLFAGSRILSELTRTGITKFDEIITDENGKNGKVIFPSDPKADSLPNRFVAQLKISTEDISDIKSYLQGHGTRISQYVQAEWIKIAEQGLNKGYPNHKVNFQEYTENETVFTKGVYQQISQLLDIHWAFQEIENDGYKSAYENLEALVGSIKNVRAFEQFNYNGIGEQGRKCSLDGERNALFYKTRKNENEKKSQPPYIYLNNAVEVDKNELNENEGLSAVSFVKRFYQKTGSFPSTAHIVLMADEEKFYEDAKEQEKADFECYKKLFEKNDFLTSCLKLENVHIKSDDIKKLHSPFDYQALYPENIDKKNYEVELQFDLVRDCFQKSTFSKYFKTKYYALVIFDGDNMGKWLSGSKLQKDAKLKDFHTKFSKLLAEYATEAKNIVKEPKGKAIYVGGDDFLGMVNVHDLFDVMKELRQKFDEQINQNAELVKLKKEGENFTFSAGIVIAHYKTPLSEVLKTARKTEKKAKNDGNRNAFAITAMKHSGEIQETVLKWGTDKDLVKNWNVLADIVKNLKKEGDNEAKFSPKFIQNLTVELMQLGGLNGNYSHHPITYVEIERLIKKSKHKDTSDDEVKLMQENVKNLWDAIFQDIKKENSVENFIHALLIADFITRKTTQDQ